MPRDIDVLVHSMWPVCFFLASSYGKGPTFVVEVPPCLGQTSLLLFRWRWWNPPGSRLGRGGPFLLSKRDGPGRAYNLAGGALLANMRPPFLSNSFIHFFCPVLPSRFSIPFPWHDLNAWTSHTLMVMSNGSSSSVFSATDSVNIHWFSYSGPAQVAVVYSWTPTVFCQFQFFLRFIIERQPLVDEVILAVFLFLIEWCEMLAEGRCEFVVSVEVELSAWNCSFC